MVEFAGTTDNPGCKVLDRLELEEVSVRCIGPHGRAIKQLIIHSKYFRDSDWLKAHV